MSMVRCKNCGLIVVGVRKRSEHRGKALAAGK